MIDKPDSEARAIYDGYDRELPFVSQLAKLCQRTATQRGYLELYDGARRHWENWEVPGVAWVEGAGPCSREEALRRIDDPDHPWHGCCALRRAETHKAMNALIQGSAARHTKLWMRACWRQGIVPLLQMHDALDCSVASPEQAERVAQLGREAVKLEVPIQVDLKFGKTWGNATHAWEEFQRTAPRPVAHPKQRNGAKVHFAAAQADPIQLPQTSVAETKMPRLTDVIGMPLRDGKICCPFHADITPSLHNRDERYVQMPAKNSQISSQPPTRATPSDGSRPRRSPVLAGDPKSENICASSGVVGGIPDKEVVSSSTSRR